jgi:hypothetical protein
MAGAQRLDQIGRHHTPTARDIDEVSAALHPREQLGVEHPHRVRRFRRRQDHKIGLAQTLLQSVRGCEIGHTDWRLGYPRINAEHTHAERTAELLCFAAGAPNPDDQYCLFREIDHFGTPPPSLLRQVPGDPLPVPLETAWSRPKRTT